MVWIPIIRKRPYLADFCAISLASCLSDFPNYGVIAIQELARMVFAKSAKRLDHLVYLH